jgi:hypothetical protein
MTEPRPLSHHAHYRPITYTNPTTEIWLVGAEAPSPSSLASCPYQSTQTSPSTTTWNRGDGQPGQAVPKLKRRGGEAPSCAVTFSSCRTAK